MKQHTIIFVPHARAKFRKWRLSTLQVCILFCSLGGLTLGGLVATALYFQSSFDRGQLTRIERENQSLREVNRDFETSIRDLEGQLAEYQERIQELAIVAGLDELSTDTVGVGGMAPLASEATTPDLSTMEIQVQSLADDMAALEGRLGERRTRLSSMPTITPVKGLFTSRYGVRSDPFDGRRAFHHGIDISAPRGRSVRATGDARVIKAGWHGSLGQVVYLAHGYGIVTRYGHLSKIEVEVGQKVRRGDIVGRVGSTGRSTGNHLHYEVHVDGEAQNPLYYILDSIQ